MMGSTVAATILQKFMDGEEVQVSTLQEACSRCHTSVLEVVRCKKALEPEPRPLGKIIPLFPTSRRRKRY